MAVSIARAIKYALIPKNAFEAKEDLNGEKETMSMEQSTIAATIPELVADQILSQIAPLKNWADFQFSSVISERVHHLNDKKSAGQITPEEEEELNLFLHLAQVTTVIKNKARLQLMSTR